MKKVLLINIVLAVMLALPSIASETTPEQEAFRASIMSFLREEGFSPSTDDDNSLTFKKEGELYWIEVSEGSPFYTFRAHTHKMLYWIEVSEGSPFYIEFHRSGFNCENADTDLVIRSCNEANKKVKCVKAYMGTSSVTLAIELYCHSAEEFKYTFYKSLKEIDKAYAAVKEYYNNPENGATSALPFSFSSCEVANSDKDGNIVTGYGQTIYDFTTKYLKPRITLNVKTEGTYDIYVKLYTPSGSLSTGNNSPSGYSYKYSVPMTSGNHTYALTGWGADTAGHWKAGDYRFEFYYKGILIGKKSFSIK